MEYGHLRSTSPYSVRMRGNTDQKTVNMDTTQCYLDPDKILYPIEEMNFSIDAGFFGEL